MCPIWKEVLDQPVQTKCWTPHIFCASCLSFSFEMCGSNYLSIKNIVFKALQQHPHVLTPSQRSVSVKPSPLVPVKPIPAAEEKGLAQVNVPSIQAELTTTTSTTTTCGEQLSVNQLLTKGSLFILRGGSWIVHHSTVPFTVSGWGNYSPQNRWLGNKIYF